MDFLSKVRVLQNLKDIFRDFIEFIVYSVAFLNRNLRSSNKVCPASVVRNNASLKSAGKFLNADNGSLVKDFVVSALAYSITPLNSNRNSSHASTLTMKHEDYGGIANANADINVSAATLLAAGFSGSGKKASGSANRDNEIILKQNTTYCMRAVATAASYINFDMQWYEHTDKD